MKLSATSTLWKRGRTIRNSAFTKIDSNSEVLKIIAQGVINSLFAKKNIRSAPLVRKVIDQGRERFALYLDDDQVSLIKVAVGPEEFFAESVRKTLLTRLGTRPDHAGLNRSSG